MAADLDRGVFVGRQAELERLDAALEAATAGKPQLVLVWGESGVGKSALIRRFNRGAASRGAAVHRAQCQPRDEASAYSLVAGLVLSLLHLTRQSSPSATAIALSEAMGPGVDGRLQAALLGHILGLEARDVAIRSLSPQQLRAGAFTALNDLVTGRAAEGLLALSAADLQWADAASVDWLTSLLDRLLACQDPLRLIVTCEMRPDQTLRLRHGGDAFELTTMQLGPLPRDQAEECAAAMLGGGRDRPLPGDAATLAEIVDRSGGNPLFLAQLLANAVESGMLEAEASGLRVQGLPASVQAAVSARLDALAGPLSRLVEVAAVLGREFDRDVLARLNGATTPPQVQELVRSGILNEDPGGRLSFVQAEFHDVAYERIPPSLRRILHLRVAEALEAEAGRDGGAVMANPNALAHHFAGGQDAPRAARYMAEAGDYARARGDHARARDCYQAALGWLSRISGGSGTVPIADVMLSLAKVLGDLGDTDGALGFLDRRLELAAESARSLRARAEVYRQQGDLDQARDTLEAALATGGDTAEVALVLASKSDVMRLAGKFNEGIALAKEALAALAAHGRQPATEAYVHSVLGICHHRLGQLGMARLEHAAALKLREAAGDIAGCAASLNNAATIDVQQGRWEQAQAGYRRSLEIARRLGDRRSIVIALENLGDLLLSRGEDVEAEGHFRESIRIAREVGAVGDEIIGIANLAMVRLARQDGPGALQEIEACWSLSELSAHVEYAAEILNLKGLAHQLAGDLSLARHNQARARGLAARSGNTALAASIDRSLAELDAAEDHVAEAYSRAKQSEEVLRKAAVPLELGRTLALLARVAPAGEREPYRREAAELFESLGARRDLARLQEKGPDAKI